MDPQQRDRELMSPLPPPPRRPLRRLLPQPQQQELQPHRHGRRHPYGQPQPQPHRRSRHHPQVRQPQPQPPQPQPLLPPPGPQTPDTRQEMEVWYLEASIIIEMYLIHAEALHPAISELLAFDATVYVEVACDLYDEGLSL